MDAVDIAGELLLVPPPQATSASSQARLKSKQTLRKKFPVKWGVTRFS
jgi:hypothetical protein